MNKKRIFILVFLVFIFLCSAYYVYHKNVNNDEETKSTMKEEKNSKTLEMAKKSENFKDEYKEDYQKIQYQEQEDFIENINILLNIGYTAEEINAIYQSLNVQNIHKLLQFQKVDLKDYYRIQNFEVDKIPRYEEYQKKYNCSLEEAVLKVNIGLDHDFYTQIEDVETVDSYTVLVNKYHSIGNYKPDDLKSLSYDSRYKLREKAADAFEELVSAAKLDNVFIRPYSAYRSYEYQTTLYNNYVNRDGKEEADTYSARPGHSEHQTGLAVDVWSEGFQYISTKDAKWLEDNSYKYGFIVRYTKENKPITGYIEEPWHIRYLGKDVATDVVSKNLTYDEYYDLYIK